MPVSVRLGTMTDVTIRIGLTGGIAAGKSTVSAHLCDLGAFVIDYDELAREVVAPEARGCVESLILSVRMRWMSGAS